MQNKCGVCSRTCRDNHCAGCIIQADDVAFERNISLAAALDFLKRDRSAQIQRSLSQDIATQKYIAKHSHPIVSHQLVFAPNVTRRAL